MKDIIQVAQERALELAVQKQEVELETAKIVLERERLSKEYVFEAMAREIGRENAMRVLQRIRVIDASKAPEVPSVGPKGMP